MAAAQPRSASMRPPSAGRGSLRRRSAAFLHDLVLPAKPSDGYDGEYRRALLEGREEVGHVATWYGSFTTIDWLHDLCKEDFRRRTLRQRPGWRGVVASNWDRLQGWLAVLLTGLFTALIAAGIISLEMWLFSIKDGYCTNGWWKARRFCLCAGAHDVSHKVANLQINKAISPRSAIATNSFINVWSSSLKGHEEMTCSAWQEWGTVLDSNGQPIVQWLLEYGVYISTALMFATFASVLTIYLSSSDSVVSTKDVNITNPAPMSERMPPHSGSHQESVPGEPTEYRHLPRSRSFVSYGATEFRHLDSRKQQNQSLRRQQSRASSHGFSQGSPVPNQDGFANTARPFSTPGSRSHSRHNSYQPLAPPFVSSEPPPLVKRKTMYFAAGSGIPEIKTLLSGFVIRGYLGGWTLLAKSVGLCFSVGSGLSLGKEGPFVHIASCVGNIISRFFHKFDSNEAKRREILSAACAAGVSVSFGAPVGGVLFSLEEVSYFFPPKVLFRSFVCAMVAATTLRFLNPFGTGKIVLFQVTYDKDWHFAELIGFAFLGIFGGVYGALFNKANVAWTKYVRNGTSLKKHPILEVAAVCLVTVAISFFNRFTRMGGTELVFEMFSECSFDDNLSGLCVRTPAQVPQILLVIGAALTAKVFLTIITFGIRVPAGIFIPTLAVGACFGRIVGLVIEMGYAKYPESPLFAFCNATGPLPAPFGQACVLPGVYSMVGATATLAGVTRTTVSLAVIMFELTGTLTYVTPVMVAVLFSVTVANAFESRSIYDLVINANHLPYLDAKEEHILVGTCMDVTDTDAPVISLDAENTVETLSQKLVEHHGRITGFPIIAEDRGIRLQGYIGYDELEQSLAAYKLELASSETNPMTPCTFRDVSARVDLKSYEDGGRRPFAAGRNILDLGYLTDKAPVTVSARAPLQLLHQLFVKLGVRYLAVQDQRGCYVGIVDKNRWLGYLHWLETEERAPKQERTDPSNPTP